jgi:hypothetical protein
MARTCLSHLSDGVNQGICAGSESLKGFEVNFQPEDIEADKNALRFEVFYRRYDIGRDFGKLL